MVILEHSSNILQLSGLKSPRPVGTWHFFSYLANNDDFKHTLMAAWVEFAETNGVHLTTPYLFWEPGKVFLRERIISYTSQFKRQSHLKYQQASKSLSLAHLSLI